jgi:alpha-D-ribose 1-methylphosphonate 5-triphosphate synthase subunit PhnG
MKDGSHSRHGSCGDIGDTRKSCILLTLLRGVDGHGHVCKTMPRVARGCDVVPASLQLYQLWHAAGGEEFVDLPTEQQRSQQQQQQQQQTTTATMRASEINKQ